MALRLLADTLSGASALFEKGMEANSAGGFSFPVDDEGRLRRFLILGSEGGTYYIGEKALGVENAACISRLMEAGKGALVVETIVDFSVNNRCAKQKPLLFALAMAAKLGDVATRRLAYAALPQVCRIPTHLFTFVGLAEALSQGTGWGRLQRKVIARWYNSKQPKQLAYAVTKYQQREGWSHTDVLRLAHVKPASDAHNLVFKYVTKGWAAVQQAVADREQGGGDDDGMATAADGDVARVMEFLGAVEAAKALESDEAATAELAGLILKHRLAREHVPTQYLSLQPVWRALLKDMPMTAMIRNLAKMTTLGLLEAGGDYVGGVCERLRDGAALAKARVHPFSVLLALKTYEAGKGDKGKLTWEPVRDVCMALDDAYYKAFGNLTPTGKRWLLALDVSGSMGFSPVNGARCITPRVGAAAMAMVTLRLEKQCDVVCFSTSLQRLDLRPRDRLDDVLRKTDNLPFGGTDCAQPMLWAAERGIKTDVFVVYTDCETWAGKVSPVEALRRYRSKMGIPAKLIVVAMTSNGFTLADPTDAGMLDVVGFDANCPNLMTEFALGNL